MGSDTTQGHTPDAVPAPDAAPTVGVDEAQAPRLAGDDVRVGPEFSDEPQAGATEPPD